MLQAPFGPEKMSVSASFLRGFIYGIIMYDLGPIKLSVVSAFKHMSQEWGAILLLCPTATCK